MRLFSGLFFLLLALALSGCETPLGESWNHVVSRVSPTHEDDSDARYGLNPNQPRRHSVDSDTAYLGPKPARRVAPPSSGTGAGQVPLKPFRSSSPAGSVSSPNALSKPAPKVAPHPTPKPSSKRQTAPTPKLEKSEPPVEPASQPTPAKSTEPPPFASPVPGKKGYVTSPFSPDAGFIDVTGLEPGTDAKDPYSGKVFRVP